MPVEGIAARWPLVGRDEELDLLERALRDSAGAVIAGEAGVGKSRLAAHFVDRVASRPVVRIAASESLQAVPLGAFAAVLPPGLSRAPRQPAEALRLVADHLVARAGAPPLVCVDDVQLLDDLSAGLVLQLAVGRRAAIVATLRPGGSCPDAVRRLWRDGHALRIQMQPLGPGDTGHLLARVLGAPVDGGTLQRIWNASRGNLLYLRELVRIGADSGSLVRSGDVWIWKGPLRVSPELSELIAEHLTGLDAASYAALEQIAIAEPVAPPVVEALGLAPHLASLEHAGLVVLAGVPPQLRLAHPLFGQVVRERVRPLRAAEIERAHAAALTATGADLLRLAIAQADGHAAPDPAILLEASVRARALANPVLATRLSRAAVDTGGGAHAFAALAEALFWEGRHGELLELLERPIPGDDDDARVRVEIHRASALYWGFGRDAEAVAVLRAAIESAPGVPAAGEAAGQCGFVLASAGHPDEALALVRPVFDDPNGDLRARVTAGSTVTVALALAGRYADALTEAQRGFMLGLPIIEEMPAAGGGRAVGCCVSWTFGGLFEMHEQTVANLYRQMSEMGDPFLGIWAHFLARNDLARGRLASAERRAAEAIALLRLYDPVRLLPWALAVHAQASAQRGDAARAGESLREIDAQPFVMKVCEAEIEIARAWSEALAGDLVAARRRVAATATAQEALGLVALANLATHELARLGAPAKAAELLAATRVQPDGRLAAAWKRQIETHAAGDAEGVEIAGEELAQIGSMLDAAECFAIAAVLHRDAGQREASRRASARALELAHSCDEPRTPALAAIRTGGAATLSAREQHIARLAARGGTRRAIADELGLSIRTVGNHLNHIYAKLGVADRASLAALLADPESR